MICLLKTKSQKFVLHLINRQFHLICSQILVFRRLEEMLWSITTCNNNNLVVLMFLHFLDRKIKENAFLDIVCHKFRLKKSYFKFFKPCVLRLYPKFFMTILNYDVIIAIPFILNFIMMAFTVVRDYCLS